MADWINPYSGQPGGNSAQLRERLSAAESAAASGDAQSAMNFAEAALKFAANPREMAMAERRLDAYMSSLNGPQEPDDTGTAAAAPDATPQTQGVNEPSSKRGKKGRKDTLGQRALAQYYGYAYDLIWSIPELRNAFIEATQADDPRADAVVKRFQAAILNSQWYKENDENARRAWEQETRGGADWTDQLDAARELVRQRAVELGYKVQGPDLDRLARAYIYGGWGKPGRQGELDQALGGFGVEDPTQTGKQNMQVGTEVGGGKALETAQRLRTLAQRNGVKYDDGWFEGAARSVASGLTTIDTWTQDIFDKAASAYPVFADKIRAGQSAYDLASPYIYAKADTLELNYQTIGLDDPDVQQALTGQMDDKGNAMAMPLYDYKMMLRKRPEWGYTKQASDKAGEITTQILKMFGVMG